MPNRRYRVILALEEVSILYWRCGSKTAAATAATGVAVSILYWRCLNFGSAMRALWYTEWFQFSIGDAAATAAAMYKTVEVAVSILYWRCRLLRVACVEGAVSFQFSIGDACTRSLWRAEGAQPWRFNSLLEMLNDLHEMAQMLTRIKFQFSIGDARVSPSAPRPPTRPCFNFLLEMR